MAQASFLQVKVLQDDDDISQHYNVHRSLGAGMFGETVEVTSVGDPSGHYAMKVQAKASDWMRFLQEPEQTLIRLFNELLILNRILPKHPNLIEIKDILVGPSKVNIVQELCRGPTTEKFFRVCNEASARRAFKQLAEAVQTMHQYGVVHCDIKPDNILFKDPEFMQLKLIDFGCSTYRPDWAVKRHNDFDYTKWLKPEELGPTNSHPFHDVQALGSTLHSILAGRCVPFLYQDAMTQVQTTYRPRTEKFSPGAMDLLMGIGPPPFGPEEPGLYFTMDQICQHPWVTGLASMPLQPAKQGRDLNSELAKLETDLTVLQRLFREWMVMPLTVVKGDRELSLEFEIRGPIERGATLTRVLEVTDAMTNLEKSAMKVIHGRVRGAPESLPGGYETRPPLLVYKELLITLRILPRHNNIVAIQDVLVHREYVALVKEYLEGETLEEFFVTANNVNARNVFKQIADTVRFLHLHGVVHMDLHPSHLAFTEKWRAICKIVNFSKAVFVQQMATSKHENFQAERYLTPELLQLAPHANAQVDVTALGRILHAMMAGKWEPEPARCGNHYPRRDMFGEAATDLLSKIGPEPFGPPTNNRTFNIEQICNHPWLRR